MQFSSQPNDISAEPAEHRATGKIDGRTKGERYADAKKQDLFGRSRMSKAQLAKAVGG